MPPFRSSVGRQGKRQIMEGKFGIRDKLKEQADDAMNSAEAKSGGGKYRGLRKLIAGGVEEWTEDKLVEAWIDEALARIDEGRHDQKNSNKKTGGEAVAFDDDEFIIAFDLAMRGSTVESRDEVLITVGNPDGEVFDAYVDDVRSEFKTINNNRPEVIRKNIEPSSVDRVRGAFSSAKRDVTTLTHVEVSGEVQAPLNEIGKSLDCKGWD